MPAAIARKTLKGFVYVIFQSRSFLLRPFDLECGDRLKRGCCGFAGADNIFLGRIFTAGSASGGAEKLSTSGPADGGGRKMPFFDGGPKGKVVLNKGRTGIC